MFPNGFSGGVKRPDMDRHVDATSSRSTVTAGAKGKSARPWQSKALDEILALADALAIWSGLSCFRPRFDTVASAPLIENLEFEALCRQSLSTRLDRR